MERRQVICWLRRVVRLWGDTRGDVLLEYVLLTTLIILPLVTAGSMLFNPSGVPLVDVNGVPVIDPETGQAVTFGLLGDVFVSLYQRVVCGIGLPIP